MLRTLNASEKTAIVIECHRECFTAGDLMMASGLGFHSERCKRDPCLAA